MIWLWDDGDFTRENDDFTREFDDFTMGQRWFDYRDNGDFTRENDDFIRENDDFTRENCDFTRENGDFTMGKWWCYYIYGSYGPYLTDINGMKWIGRNPWVFFFAEQQNMIFLWATKD